MRNLGMEGPYDLTKKNINDKVSQAKAGNYALGRVGSDGTFFVKYVGRADSDVNDRLLAHVNESYTAFKYCYATSPKAAFEKECHNYHDFDGAENKLDNKIHPDRPSNSKSWKCPVCDIFDND